MKSFPVNASGRRKVAQLIQRGWFPGCRTSDLKPIKRRRASRLEAGGHAE